MTVLASFVLDAWIRPHYDRTLADQLQDSA